jgi:hypothetical protein
MAQRFKFPSSLPWYMFDLYNKQLITSATIPEGEIKDVKSVVIVETPIPGRNFQPVSVGGNGNRKISFTLPIVNRNGSYGNILLVKQFELLRNQSAGFLGTAKKKGQFTPNPRVLYSWGIGSVPLVWYVSKCDFSHRAQMVNAIGFPQYSAVEIELTLDETDPLYKAEEMFRDIAAVLGETLGLIDTVSQQIGAGSPF